VKLSYAQMAQRAKERAEREAAQRQKDQDDPSITTSSASKEQTSTSSATTSAAGSSGTVATRPQTLKESTANRLPPRTSEPTFRKDRDREDFRDFTSSSRGGPAPYSARRAKENRGEVRPGGASRDFYPPRGMTANGDRENFRDNRDRFRERRRPERDYYDSPPQQRVANRQ
jgi:hypothetical protein